MDLPFLSILIALPTFIALVVAFNPERLARTLGLFGAWSTFALSVAMLILRTAPNANGFFYVKDYVWLADLGVSFKVGADGPAMLLVVLTTFLTAFAVQASQNVIRENQKAFYALMLLMEAAMIGAFVSLDLILFYVFFEAVLIPAYFLIGIYGGTNRVAAGLKFLLYTLVGSLLMLVSIIALYLHAGQTFDYEMILAAVTASPMTGGLAAVAFGGFALAFAIKTPLFPFHTWLPDTYVESPTPVTVVLAGAMGKLGVYGFYRFVLPLFPDLSRQAAPAFVWLAVAAIIYGALVAAVQRDTKRLIAYSSVSHLGFIIMGLFSGTAYGVSGAMLQAINHGVTTGALFLIAGILYERRGSNRIASFGGLWEQMPVFGRIFLIVTFSAIALPLTNGFVGEFLILLGTFQTFPLAAGIATTGVIWSAVYMLWMFQRVMYGPVRRAEVRRLRDLSGAETGRLAPFVAVIFLFGIAPWLFTRMMDPSVKSVVELVSGQAAGSRGIPALAPSLATPTETGGDAVLTPPEGVSETVPSLPREGAEPTPGVTTAPENTP
ncbi:MAG: NADH-quinone oxidoreductase subunit M [Akkermansiaceae bacterium]|nr:NADH-quinone oxidoreductase subunit M [Armatimonadota bacterium]